MSTPLLSRPPERPPGADSHGLPRSGAAWNPDSDGESFDHIVRLATVVCAAPAGVIALVDGDRFRRHAGSGIALDAVPRDGALSMLALREPGHVIEIGDIAADPRFAQTVLQVDGGPARFYAGIALCEPKGTPIGVLCVLDCLPRTLDARQRESLALLAGLAQRLLELDRHARQQQRELAERRDFARALEHRATHDTLTGLLNRDALADLRRSPDALARLGASPYCLMLFDIDHFKQVNDRHGHLLGDRTLREVATAVADSIRAEDVAVRFGGEEFLVVLPSTALASAVEIADRIRRRVATLPLPFALSLSAGVAAGDPALDRPEEVFERADQALYRAKAGGRDRVVADDTLRSLLPPTG